MLNYTEEYEIELCNRITAMEPEERLCLDAISKALSDYFKDEPILLLPNRIIALACVDLQVARQKLIYEESYYEEL